MNQCLIRVLNVCCYNVVKYSYLIKLAFCGNNVSLYGDNCWLMNTMITFCWLWLVLLYGC